ncbi:MAG: PadR family transcriptional regulator [Jatrophihabitans sp.]|uniref:PadR family transcriptional regulator n=1 Tax=Jatrophihabitans sp. TaxID=1932789 RepID=UPI003F7FE08B
MSVRFGLLTLLERQPMYGYQLRQEFEASTGATWPLNVGQVYTTLTRLERDGLVEVAGAEGGEPTGDQRVYAINDTGRAEVAAWFATPVQQSSPPRDELAIKLALAVDTPGVDVRAVIQTQRTATVRALQEFTRARESAADDLSWLLVADSLIFAAEAEIRWLDHCETRLARHRGAPRRTVSEPVEPTVTAKVGRR